MNCGVIVKPRSACSFLLTAVSTASQPSGTAPGSRSFRFFAALPPDAFPLPSLQADRPSTVARETPPVAPRKARRDMECGADMMVLLLRVVLGQPLVAPRVRPLTK